LKTDTLLKGQALDQEARQHSYELTQRLTFYVISVEIIFCGYLLLISDKLIGIKYISWLFLLSGLAAFFGLIWRFFYNETYHEETHEKKVKYFEFMLKLQTGFYYAFIIFSIAFFWGLLIVGYCQLEANENVKKKAPTINEQTINKAIDNLSHIANALNRIADNKDFDVDEGSNTSLRKKKLK
jgi:hypothetical protein